MPIIINEDKALKLMLTGIKVHDSGSAERPVGVWFGQPDVEIRNQSFPYITIDFLGYSEAFDRAHRGLIELGYNYEGYDPNLSYIGEYPIPVNLDYQVTTYARQPRHDRQIMAEMLTGQRIPLRFGELVIPEDNTVRRMDLLGMSKRTLVDANGKRLFSNVYNVRISAEVLPSVLEEKHIVTEAPQISFNNQLTPFETITN